MAKNRSFKSEIKTGNNSLSVVIEEDKSQILEQIIKELEKLPLKDSIREEKEILDKIANEIYTILFDYDRDRKIPTDNQIYKYLKKIDKMLGNLGAELDKMPWEIKELLMESDYLKDTYFQIFPDSEKILKSRLLIGEAIRQTDTFKESLDKDLKNPKNERGNKKIPFNYYLSEYLASTFHYLTGRLATRSFDPTATDRTKQERSAYFYFVEAIFKIGKIKASSIHQTRKSIERLDKKSMELIEKK